MANAALDLCAGRDEENSGQEPELDFGAGVGSEQVLPLSRMTAATVPLQAWYGELSLRSRSKPALTTAAQRCSWVRIVSVQGPEDRADSPSCPKGRDRQTPGAEPRAYLPMLREVSRGWWGVTRGSARDKKR